MYDDEPTEAELAELDKLLGLPEPSKPGTSDRSLVKFRRSTLTVGTFWQLLALGVTMIVGILAADAHIKGNIREIVESNSHLKTAEIMLKIEQIHTEVKLIRKDVEHIKKGK